MFAIEYHCEKCRKNHSGRFFKKPDLEDINSYSRSTQKLQQITHKFIPDDDIEPGDESNRLLRWGYKKFRDLFNQRQLFSLELSAQYIHNISDERIKRALVTNFSDLLRYQNMLCRYDTNALKSLDIFSIHGFPVSLIQCEANFLGTKDSNGQLIGSGGFLNIITKYSSAKSYCKRPFEFKFNGKSKRKVLLPKEWIGEDPNDHHSRQVEIECRDSTSVDLTPNKLDAVFTDPPYFGNVQYGELMEFCYVWVKRLDEGSDQALRKPSVREHNELTGNTTLKRDIAHFTEGLSRTFRQMKKAMKKGAPLSFTYHHNDVKAYIPIAVAVLDSNFVCTGAYPCPAEMGGSIHISGTGSSILDTLFVCRDSSVVEVNDVPKDRQEIASIVRQGLEAISSAGYSPKEGDLLCSIYGQLTRKVIGDLSSDWDSNLSINERLDCVGNEMSRWLPISDIADILNSQGSFDKELQINLFS